MTKDLTEQWKKGELKDGYYYVKIKGDRDYMLEWADNHWYEFGWDCWFFDNDIIEVLAEIPSYEEWGKLKFRVDLYHDYLDLEKDYTKHLKQENAKLKELLKDARNVLKMVDTYCGDNDSINGFLIVEKIDEALK